jgi:hypothetical protein
VKAPARADSHARTGSLPRGLGRRNLLLLVAGVAVAVAGALVVVDRLHAEKTAPVSPVSEPGADPRVWPKELIVPSERSFKLDLIEKLDKPPEVIFFGGSRSSRLEGSYVQEKTGLTGFNLAFTNGKPEDAWAFAHYLHDRSPQTKLRWIWGIQPWTFKDRPMDAALIQDPRLNRYFPDTLLRDQGKLLPQTPDKVPKHRPGYNWRYAADGARVWDYYDQKYSEGLTFEEVIAKAVARASTTVGEQTVIPPGTPFRMTRARSYFEKTLAYLNQIGVKPILVGMPMQPTVLQAFVDAGGQKSYPRFLEYVDSLHKKYDFDFIDLLHVDSFGGDPDDFYDGVHLRRENAHRLIDKLIASFPDQFAKQPGDE